MSEAPDDTGMEFLQGIEADISDPERWPSLSHDRLCEVIGTTILLYADFTAEELIPKIQQMYPYVVERVPPERRMQMMKNIIRRFSNEKLVPDDATRHRVDALLPFIVADPDPLIVTGATFEFCVLRARTDFPWFGVDQVFSMFEQGGAQYSAGILMGLISLGDRRLTPGILSMLASTDPTVAQEVSKVNTQYVMAAMVDLCCDWLEAVQNGPASGDPGGATFGHVAAAIYRLGTQAEETGVTEISRYFPPPTPDDWAVSHERWTRAEYARVVGPRLQSLAEREQKPRILPRVMGAWGVEFVCPN